MPFTLSHAVLAVPIAKITADKLPIAAVAIGCMLPDLYRLLITEGQADGYVAHYWRSLLYPTLCLGVFFSGCWYGLYRPVIYRFLGIEHALNLSSFRRILQFFFALCLALLIGTASHIIWDGLTHADFRTLFFKAGLEQQISIFTYSVPLHRLLQIASSIVTLPLLFYMLWHYYQQHKMIEVVSRKIRYLGWGLLFCSMLSGAIAVADYWSSMPLEFWLNNLYQTIGYSFNHFTKIALMVFSLGCIVWRICLK